MKEENETYSAIAQAVIDLVSVKALEKITVEEIVLKSGFSRRTFYNKFRDKYDVIEWIYTMHVQSVADKFGEPMLWREFVLGVAKIVSENKKFYQRLFGGDHWATEQFGEVVREYFLKVVKTNHTIDGADERIFREVFFLTDFYCSAFSNKIADWVNWGFQETPEELLILFNRSLSEELRQLLRIENRDA